MPCAPVAPAGPIIASLSGSLRPGGQLVLTALARIDPLTEERGLIERWAALEARDPADIATPAAIATAMQRVGMDIRIAEDISDRHIGYGSQAWKVLLAGVTPNKAEAGLARHLVTEAEAWHLRRRLIESGRLRMMRWHAIRVV
jgi:hypothetical protein